MVPVGIPVAVGVLLCRAAVYYKIAACVLIEAAYDIQQRRLAAAGVTEHGDEFGFSELKVDALERVHRLIADRVVLGYAF